MTHTPGPWATYGASENVMGESIAFDVVGADFFPVAEVHITCILPDYQERTGHPHWARAEGETFIKRATAEVVANAHLIAAAPELYEALLAVVDCWDRGGLEVDALIEGARAALARARGEVAA